MKRLKLGDRVKLRGPDGAEVAGIVWAVEPDAVVVDTTDGRRLRLSSLEQATATASKPRES